MGWAVILCFLFDISGAATATSCFDQQNSSTISSTGTAGTINNTASITTTKANVLLVSFLIADNSGSPTPQSPWATTAPGWVNRAFRITSTTNETATGTYNMPFTVAANNDDCATFTLAIVSSSQPSTSRKRGAHMIL
jgi:hypothetical protein